MFGNDLEIIVVDVEFYSKSMVRIKVSAGLAVTILSNIQKQRFVL